MTQVMQRSVEIGLAYPALRPVEPELRARDGLERDDCNIRQADLAPQPVLERVKVRIGPGQPPQHQVVIGYVVIARLNRNRNRQMRQPFGGQSKFLCGSPHRQIAGANHTGRPFSLHLAGKPFKRLAILIAKVQVTRVVEDSLARH